MKFYYIRDFLSPFFLLSALTRAFAQKKGRDNVTLDDLVQLLTPKGRGEFYPFACSLPENTTNFTASCHDD